MLNKRLLVLLLVGGLVALLAIPPAFAANNDSHTVTFTNNATVDVSIPETTYGFGAVNPAGSPYTSANDVVNVTVKSNANWTLNVKGSGAFSDGTNSVPLSQLQWSENNGTPSWTPMTVSDTQVATGSKTGGTGVTKGMEYKLTITYDDEASATQYSTTVTYTGTSP